jgi:photosystem II stability/assembly factor-like uncharacterized protein
MKQTLMKTAIVILIALMTGCGEDNDTTKYTGWAIGANVEGYGTIIHTEDSGKTWVRQGDASSIPDVFIEDVSAVDAQHAWVVGDGAPEGNSTSFGTILYSEDGGKNWVRQGSASTIPDTSFVGVSAVSREMAWTVGTGGGDSVHR